MQSLRPIPLYIAGGLQNAVFYKAACFWQGRTITEYTRRFGVFFFSPKRFGALVAFNNNNTLTQE